MERIQNTDQPLSSLTGIRKMISYDDNDTNVKYQSKTKLEGLNNMLLSRQNTFNQVRLIEKDIYDNIISKLKRVLSKRFNLSEREYILLVDKYSLKNSELSRDKIMEMINYLNIQNKYNINNVKTKKLESNVIKRQEDINHIRDAPSYGSMILTPACEAEIQYLDKTSNKQSLEERLQEMQLERDSTRPQPNMATQSAMTKRPDMVNQADMVNQGDMSKHSNIVKQADMINQIDMTKHPVAMTKQPAINIPKLKNINIDETTYNHVRNIDMQKDRNISNEYSVNREYNFNTESKMNSIEYDSKIPEYDNEDKKPKLVITDINQNKPNSGIENSLQQIVEDLKKSSLYNSTTSDINKETYTLNLMANIITSKSTINSTSKQLEFNVSYNNKNSIDNVSNVEFVSCFVNKNFYEKNDFKNSPYFLIKICEFEDILYLNGTNIGGFCQIMWERKGNYYNYINSDKLFGIYTPKSTIQLDKLTIELYNHKGELLDNIKSTEQDQFNIVLKITQAI